MGVVKDMIRFTQITILIVLIGACNTNPEKKFDKDKTFPKVKDLTNFNHTVFVPTLESDFSRDENAIYAASLLMDWDEVRNVLAEPIINIESDELKIINNSQSFRNVLSENEFQTSSDVEDSIIYTKAYFRKSLPFKVPFERDTHPLIFLDDSVESFSFYGYNRAASLVYYHNDNDFALKLFPADIAHEIILVKSDFKAHNTLKVVIDSLQGKTKDFQQNSNESNYWKYHFNDEDHVRIPIIEFNIETNYSAIEETYIKTASRELLIETMYQRTAFVLNEKGAEVESVAEVAVEEMAEELPKPKRLFFDSPFIILLKRKTSEYPYFAMYVSNSELMVK